MAYGNPNTMGMTQSRVASSPIGSLPILGGAAGLLSGFFGQNKAPSAEDLRKKFGPQQLAGDTTALYQFMANSPQFRAMLMRNAATGSQFSNALQGNLASRGLTTSGIGSVASAAGKQATSTGETVLRGGLFGQAQEAALQNLLARLQAYTSMRGQELSRPGFFENLGGSLLGGAAGALF